MLNHFFGKVFALERIYQNKAYSLGIGTPTWSIGTPIWRDHRENVERPERNPRETWERPKRDDCTPTPSCPKLLQSHYEWLTCPKEGSIQSKQTIGFGILWVCTKTTNVPLQRLQTLLWSLRITVSREGWLFVIHALLKGVKFDVRTG